MALTGSADGSPRFAAGPLASAALGAARVLQTLVGDGRFDSLDAPALLAERAALYGLTRSGRRSAGGSARLLSARDGTLALNLPRGDDWHLMPAWLEADLPFDTHRAPPELERDAAWQQIETRIAKGAVDELVDRGRLMGLAIAKAARLRDCGGQARAPFFELEGGTQSVPRRDLHRLRVLDLSTLWAGPLATSLLAQAGLEILKVESPTRPDGARNGPEAGANAFFDLMNGGKQGCALDLTNSMDRASFERLLESADVVVESARPRSLSQLGYDARGWVDARAGRIWTSITGYGRANEWIAFGDDAAVAAGLAWSPDAQESDACFCADAIADPLTGLHVAAIVLAHLRLGRGGLFDVSLSGIANRAARAAHAGLVLPVEHRGNGWCVIESGRAVAIQRPRARAVGRAAPALAAPTGPMLSAWSPPRC